MRLVLTSLLLVFSLAGCATYDEMMGKGPNAPVKTTDGALTNSAGMTLYTFDRDAAGSGKSVCNGPCATNWPPLMAASDARAGGDWSIIARDDGSKQWAYKGRPLYLWSKDAKPGDRTGNGFNGVWKTATP